MKRESSDINRFFAPAVFRQWNQRLMQITLPIVRDADVAADICQEVWIRFAQHKPEDRNISGWLATVAKRLSLNYLSSGAVRFRVPGDIASDEFASPEPLPDEVLRTSQRALVIRETLEALRPRHSEVIRLCDWDGLSYAEASRQMGVSEPALTSLLFRARQAFRKEYIMGIAPPWLRSLAETGPIDEIIKAIDPFAPDAEPGELDELQAHHVFANIAQNWDRIREDSVPDGLDEEVAGRAGLSPADWALDAGTGTGVVALHVAKLVRRVVGIDRSLPMLRIARERAEQEGPGNVNMEYGDLNKLAVRDGVFDVAFCSLVLRHARNPGEVVSSIARTLRGGGKLVVCDRLRETLDRNAPGLDPAMVERWLDDAGMGDVSVETIGGDTYARYVVAVARRQR